MVAGRKTYGNSMVNMCRAVLHSNCGVREKHGVIMRKMDGKHEGSAWKKIVTWVLNFNSFFFYLLIVIYMCLTSTSTTARTTTSPTTTYDELTTNAHLRGNGEGEGRKEVV